MLCLCILSPYLQPTGLIQFTCRILNCSIQYLISCSLTDWMMDHYLLYAQKSWPCGMRFHRWCFSLLVSSPTCRLELTVWFWFDKSCAYTHCYFTQGKVESVYSTLVCLLLWHFTYIPDLYLHSMRTIFLLTRIIPHMSLVICFWMIQKYTWPQSSVHMPCYATISPIRCSTVWEERSLYCA